MILLPDVALEPKAAQNFAPDGDSLLNFRRSGSI
jgi:hypothetical protein